MATVITPDGQTISTDEGDQGFRLGKWGEIQSFTNSKTYEVFKLPDSIQGVVDGINTTIDFLNAQLEIALAALRVAKAWLLDFFNPIYDLVEEIVRTIEQIVRDLLSVGLYVTGDWGLLDASMSRLEGGYPKFEQRMSARFTDTKDSTRPDIPPTVDTWAIFFFIGTNLTGVRQIIALILQLIRFFKFPLKTDTVLSTPVNLTSKFGIDGVPDFWQDYTEDMLARPWVNTGDDTAYNTATVTWELGKDGKSPYGYTPTPLPNGFLVTVSTVREGLRLYYDRPLSNAAQETAADGSKRQLRESDFVLDELQKPVILHGGADMIELQDAKVDYNQAMDGAGVVKAGANRIWAQTDTNGPIIPLSLLKDGSDYILQRTFYVSMAQILFAQEGSLFGIPGLDFILQNPALFADAKYRIKLKYEDMPFPASFKAKDDGTIERTRGERPSTFHARVCAVSGNINSNTDFRYLIRDETIGQEGVKYKVEYPDILDANNELVSISRNADLSQLSEPLAITFPLEGTSNFVRALTASLAILVLSRSDLPVSNLNEVGKALRETLLESYAKDYASRILGQNPDTFFKTAISAGAEDLSVFRETLLKGCERVAREIFNSTSFSRALLEDLLPQVDILRTWKWTDAPINGLVVGGETINSGTYAIPPLTILESLRASNSEGIARNPWSANVPYFGTPMTITGAAAPYFWADSSGRLTTPYAPVLVISKAGDNNSRKLLYIRSLIPDEVYLAAATVLNLGGVVSRDPGDGGWINVRLGKFLEPFVKYLDMVLAWSRGLLDGLKGVINKIIEYIEFLESRILELQQLLKRIQAFLSLMYSIRLPIYQYLVVQGAGLAGIHQGFLGADEKPTIGSEQATPAFNIGTTGVAGIIPQATFATDQTIGGEPLKSLDQAGSPRDGEQLVSAEAAEADLPDPPVKDVNLTYGAGVAMVAAGAPTILIELLTLLFTDDDSEGADASAQDTIEYF